MTTLAMVSIGGVCDARFERVRRTFESSFDRGELGASVAVTIDGRPVVDLWGGHVDKARTKAWEEDTLVNVFSVTKGIAAVCALRLVERGRLALDEPVSRYWPEFAQAYKARVRVRDLLSHRAGLPAIARRLPPEALFDWGAMTDALAAQAPWWPPGAAHGYHAITYGWLVGETIRRAAGKSVTAFVRDEIAGPLGIDFHIGLPGEHAARVTDLRGASPPAPGQRSLVAEIAADPTSLTALAFTNPAPLVPAIANSPAYRAAELPSVNGHTNARALARLYGALASGGAIDGARLLEPATIDRARAQESSGMDLILGEPTRFGLGFMLSHDGLRLGPNDGAFGHPGAGGSLGFADPAAKLGFGYTMNKMGSSLLMDPRASALIDAVYASL